MVEESCRCFAAKGSSALTLVSFVFFVVKLALRTSHLQPGPRP